jgi:crotonobetainyl-CoA:carnitine CoA-transferase CaiB-like acyl-CoA transferase
MERLGSAGIPCSPVRTFDEVVEHPQTAARNMFPEIDCPVDGRRRVVGPAVKLSETPARVTNAAPGLGQDTEAVLAELLGLDEDAIGSLAKAGIIP